jgi:hypothetical protein
MGPNSLRALLAILLFWSVNAALAAEAPRRTEELMRLSGLWTQVGAMQAQVRAGIEEASRQAPPGDGIGTEELRILMTRASEAYAPERLRPAVAAELAARMTAEDEESVLEWLRSDLGRRFTGLEERSSEVEFQQRIEREAAAYAAALPEARLERIRRFEKSARAGEGATDMTINTAVGIAYGVLLATPRGDPALLGPLRKRIESQRPAMAETMKQRMIEALAFIYKDVSDADLDRYAQFAESPAGRRYHDASGKALAVALVKAAIEMGEQFGRGLAEPRRAT